MAPLTTERIEAPVTVKAYFMCAFAAFAGFLFGYDSGYINAVLATSYVREHWGQLTPQPNGSLAYDISSPHQSLIVSMLSAGTFFGAIFAGACADWFGRRTTIIAGALVYMVGVILQVAANGIPLLVVGRTIAGVGVGFVSATVILYMSEIAPRKVRGAIVSCYQWAITIGILLAAVVGNATKNRTDTGSYRIPIAIQFLWGIILVVGLLLLPESPRWYVKKQRLDQACKALARVRGQSPDSDFVQDELAEIQANYEYELQVGEVSWLGCFTGGLGVRNSNVRKVTIGILLQMMQQWTGVNFIFYYSTTFFGYIGIQNGFVVSLITDAVNVGSTPLSFWTIERFGRRFILIYGAIAMCICEFIVAIIGSTVNYREVISAQHAMVAFICIYIFFFASTWGPAAWVCIGELFPITMRSKGVGLSTASNWFWNCIIAVITPYLMGPTEGNLQTNVFYLWGSTCFVCILFAYFLVPETKGLSLEQVDKMMEEVTARKSAGWKPSTTFAAEMGYKEETTINELAHKQEA